MLTESDPAPAITGLTSDYVDVQGHRWHYWSGGPTDGVPAVLVHGFLSTGYAWREIAPALVEAGMAVLVVDLLGYGDSEKPAGDDGYDPRALAEGIRAVATGLGLLDRGPTLLVAHDMGAPPALLWAADHPEEVAGLVYAEAPVLLGDQLREVFSFTPEAMADGSMWWWILPLAPGVPEALIAGHEENFLRWFFDGPHGDPDVFTPDVVAEYRRTYTGVTALLGSMGVYRTVFTGIGQTEALLTAPITVPAVAVGGRRSLGAGVGRGLGRVVIDVDSVIIDCGHFVPEEAPAELVAIVLRMRGARAPGPGSRREK